MLEIVGESMNQEQKIMKKWQYAHAEENDFDDMLLMTTTQSKNEQILCGIWIQDVATT